MSLTGWDLLAAAVFVVLAGIGGWLHRDFQCDDAFIAYRYVENLIQGRGWVYNPGEAVSGATSPLHILLLTVLRSLTGDVPRAAHLLGALCLAAAAWFSYLLLRGIGRPEGGIAAGLLLLSSPFLLSTFGMETMLYLALAMAAVYWYHTGRLLVSGACLGLLIITRADGVLLAAVLLCHHLATRRRFPLAPAALAAIIALPWFSFSAWRFGSPFPSTLGARVAQGVSGHALRFLQGSLFWVMFSLRESLWYLALVPCAAAGLLALVRRSPRYLTLPVWACVYFIAYSLLGVPYQHWYYGPAVLGLLVISVFWLLWVESGRSAARLAAAWAALLIVMVVGGNIFLRLGHDLYLRFRSEHSWETLRRLVSASSAGVWLPFAIGLAAAGAAMALRRRTMASRWALAAALFLPVVAAQARIVHLRSQSFPGPQFIAYRDVGSWLRRHTAPGSTVAAWEIGAIGYHSDRPILDYLGLVTPAAQPAVARGDYKWWLRERPPDYIVVRDPPGGFERAAMDDPLFADSYRAAATLKWPNWPPMTIYQRVGGE